MLDTTNNTNYNTSYNNLCFFTLCNKIVYYNDNIILNYFKDYNIESIDVFNNIIYFVIDEVDFIIICKGCPKNLPNNIKLVNSQLDVGTINSYFKDILDIVLPFVLYKISKYNTHNIWCTGHEFGGCIINAIVYYLNKHNINVIALYTFSICTIGDILYEEEIKKINCYHYKSLLSNKFHKINTMDKINNIIKIHDILEVPIKSKFFNFMKNNMIIKNKLYTTNYTTTRYTMTHYTMTHYMRYIFYTHFTYFNHESKKCNNDMLIYSKLICK